MATTITERGWAGHFCAAADCLFRRNTLICNGDVRYVVSTVGNFRLSHKKEIMHVIGLDRYYETLIFPAIFEHGYWEADHRQGELNIDELPWAIGDTELGTNHAMGDQLANDMHEATVQFVVNNWMPKENGEAIFIPILKQDRQRKMSL